MKRLLFILGLVLVPVLAWAGTTIDSYPSTSFSANQAVRAGAVVGVGNSFTGNGMSVATAQFYLQRSGTIANGSNCFAVIYAHSGTFGTSSIPTGTALATSNAIDASTLSTTQGLVTFTFPTPYVTVSGTKYVVTFEFAGGSSNKLINAGYGTAAGSGNFSSKTATTWTANSARRLVFYVQAPNTITGTVGALIQQVQAAISGPFDGITGALGATLDRVTASVSGVVGLFTATISAQITNVLASISAYHGIVGTAGAVLTKVNASLSGSTLVAAIGALTSQVTSLLTGDEGIGVTLAPSLEQVTASMYSPFTIVFSLFTNLEQVTAGLASQFTVAFEMGGALGKVTFQGAALEGITSSVQAITSSVQALMSVTLIVPSMAATLDGVLEPVTAELVSKISATWVL